MGCLVHVCGPKHHLWDQNGSKKGCLATDPSQMQNKHASRLDRLCDYPKVTLKLDKTI